MNFFRRLLGRTTFFQDLDPLTQWRTIYALSCAELLRQNIDKGYLERLESSLKRKLSVQRQCLIGVEVALTVTHAGNVTFNDNDIDRTGCNETEFRHSIADLILSLANDERTKVEPSSYSANPDEAYLQLGVAVAEIIDASDDALLQKITNSRELNSLLGGFFQSFFPAIIASIRKRDLKQYVPIFSEKIENLDQRSLTIIKGWMQTIKGNSSLINSPDRREQESISGRREGSVSSSDALEGYDEFFQVLSSGDQLTDILVKTFWLIDLEQPEPMRAQWRINCIVFTMMVFVAARMTKYPNYRDSDGYRALYALLMAHLMDLQRNVLKDIGPDVPFDEARVTLMLKKSMQEAYDGVKYFLEKRKRDSFPEGKLIVWLLVNIGVDSPPSTEGIGRLRTFSQSLFSRFCRC